MVARPATLIPWGRLRCSTTRPATCLGRTALRPTLAAPTVALTHPRQRHRTRNSITRRYVILFSLPCCTIVPLNKAIVRPHLEFWYTCMETVSQEGHRHA